MVVKGLTLLDALMMLALVISLAAYPVVLLAYVLAHYAGSDRIRGVAVRWGTPVLLVLGLVNSLMVLGQMFKKEEPPRPPRTPGRYRSSGTVLIPSTQRLESPDM